MKSMFEYMGTIIIFTLFSFVLISLMSIEFQTIAARNYHTRVVEIVQYEGDYANADEHKYGDDFIFELNNDNTLKIIYNYNVKAPIIGTIHAESIIGYAR